MTRLSVCSLGVSCNEMIDTPMLLVVRLRGVKFKSFFQDTVTRLHQAALFLINALLVWNGIEFNFFSHKA